MVSKVGFHGSWLLGAVVLSSCQLVSGLSELDTTDGTGGGLVSDGDATGGRDGAGGGASCLLDWKGSNCQGACGDRGDGIWIGCGNFMACYVEENCLPEDCSSGINDACGINQVEGGTEASLAMAQEVVACMCGP